MKTASAKIILRSNYVNSDGSRGVYLKFITGRKTYLISLGIHTSIDKWDEEKARLRRSAKDSFSNNLSLDEAINKADRIILDYKEKRKALSYQQFKAAFHDQYYASESFYDYCESQIKHRKDTVSKGTALNYRFQLNKLQEFRPVLTFSDIDGNFIKDYEGYLVNTRKNNKNTITKAKIFLRTMLNAAKADKKISEHIFESHTISRISGNRAFLTRDELTELRKLLGSDKLKDNRKNVLRYFLFSCFTGLRYQDIKALSWNHIQDNKWISIVQHKTREPVRIPIIQAAADLLPSAQHFKGQKVFKVLSDQPTNRYLKDIMNVAEISKRISFHSARHTFGTVAMDLGIPMETISKILGHTEIQTTAIYARIRDGKKQTDMQKFNEAFNS